LWDEYASGETDKDRAIKDGEKAQVIWQESSPLISL
jgi:hypothetical protein